MFGTNETCCDEREFLNELPTSCMLELDLGLEQLFLLRLKRAWVSNYLFGKKALTPGLDDVLKQSN